MCLQCGNYKIVPYGTARKCHHGKMLPTKHRVGGKTCNILGDVILRFLSRSVIVKDHTFPRRDVVRDLAETGIFWTLW